MDQTGNQLATRQSWRAEPLGNMKPVPYTARFSHDEFESIIRGLIPREMEDKWFIYAEDGTLFLHRSWTGHCVYTVRFRRVHDGYEVADARVATDEDFYRRRSDKFETALIDFLIRGLLLRQKVEFPVPGDIGVRGPVHGLFQHQVAGTAFSQRLVGRERLWNHDWLSKLIARFRRLRRSSNAG